jgi:hypothetical protein
MQESEKGVFAPRKSVAQYYKRKLEEQEKQLLQQISKELNLSSSQAEEIIHHYRDFINYLTTQPPGLTHFPKLEDKKVSLITASTVHQMAKALKVNVHHIEHDSHIDLAEVYNGSFRENSQNKFFPYILRCNFDELKTKHSLQAQEGILLHEMFHIKEGDFPRMWALCMALQTTHKQLLNKSPSFKALATYSETRADTKAALINPEGVKQSLIPYCSGKIDEDKDTLHPHPLKRLKEVVKIGHLLEFERKSKKRKVA